MLQNVLLQNTDVDLDLFISNLYIDTIMEIFCGAPATSILKQSPKRWTVLHSRALRGCELVSVAYRYVLGFKKEKNNMCLLVETCWFHI